MDYGFNTIEKCNDEIVKKHKIRKFVDKITVGPDISDIIINSLSNKYELEIIEYGDSYSNARLTIKIYKVLEY